MKKPFRVSIIDAANLADWKKCSLSVNFDGVSIVSYWQQGLQLCDIFLVYDDLKVTLYCVEV
jgi:hypothetical protein